MLWFVQLNSQKLYQNVNKSCLSCYSPIAQEAYEIIVTLKPTSVTVETVLRLVRNLNTEHANEKIFFFPLVKDHGISGIMRCPLSGINGRHTAGDCSGHHLVH